MRRQRDRNKTRRKKKRNHHLCRFNHKHHTCSLPSPSLSSPSPHPPSPHPKAAAKQEQEQGSHHRASARGRQPTKQPKSQVDSSSRPCPSIPHGENLTPSILPSFSAPCSQPASQPAAAHASVVDASKQASIIERFCRGLLEGWALACMLQMVFCFDLCFRFGFCFGLFCALAAFASACVGLRFLQGCMVGRWWWLYGMPCHATPSAFLFPSVDVGLLTLLIVLMEGASR